MKMRFIPAGAGNTGHFIFIPTESTVYPRWRGEHEQAYWTPNGETGLSPLARGTLSNLFLTSGFSRFIPAGAGNTAKVTAAQGRLSVYPRWRGEHPPYVPGILRCCGLSPLARGTR